MSPSTVLFVPLLPLLGFVLSGLLGRRLGRGFVAVVACGAMLGAFALSLGLFLSYQGPGLAITAFTWIASGSIEVNAAFLVDPLSLVMLLVVTGVGSLIHLYSIGYMWEDKGFPRFFAYLNLFVFFMLVLVLAESLPLMFVGWEGVGLCSYLLIGFWYEKPSAADAGLKAFLVNRVGDFGFMLGMLGMFAAFGTLSFTAISRLAPATLEQGGVLPLWGIALCLFFAATGKSAQIPLYVWLPDAMEGPTPVSALIHAATMVTSGVYMVARLSSLFALVPDVLYVVGVTGAVTAAFAATMGLTATDIKKVLAYSTISQLGYMFLGLGVGATSAALFHLVTHAFFKACLFLGAGAVMHAIHNETDLGKMGGLRKKIPITWVTMLLATLAIVGVPGFAGFVSKDALLVAAYQQQAWEVLLLGVVTIGLTSFYMFRLYLLAFHGEPRMDRDTYEHAHDATPSMAVALIPLGVLSVIAGFLNWPAGLGGAERFSRFLAPVLSAGHHSGGGEEHHLGLAQELLLSAGFLVPAVLGFLLALVWYRRPSGGAERFAGRHAGIYRLLHRKWYVDEIYQALVIAPAVALARFVWRWIDEIAIDGSVTLLGIGTELLGEVLRFFHTGVLRNYALFIAVGASLCLLWAVWVH